MLFQNLFLTFSDGAKFALIARNIVEGHGFGSNFTFYSSKLFLTYLDAPFNASGVPVLIPYILSVFFRIFGVSDLSVIIFSGFFYVLLVLAVFFLAKRLYGGLVGILSAIAVAANINFISYATTGASEVLYSFLAVVSVYLLLMKNKWINILFFLSLLSLYLTKPQGIVFILILVLSWFVMKLSWKRGLLTFLGLVAGLMVLDKLVLYPLSFNYPVYPIITRGIQAVFQYSPNVAVSDALRGDVSGAVGFVDVVKKTFYNLYNFYKLLPQIMSPYLFAFFALGLFVWDKNKDRTLFKVLTALMFAGTFLLAALTIPFFRYLHPVVPLVYIVAVASLVQIVSKIDLLSSKLKTPVSVFLILLFVVGQTLGVLLLDSRYEKNTHNVGKPPVYVPLSNILRDNTNKDLVIVTNLDTWGSWYGQRRTVWFPLKPGQLINPKTGTIPFGAIYLTSYLIDDPNYYMGEEWRSIFDNPKDSSKWKCEGCDVIKGEFELKGEYFIPASENYNRQDASSILLIRK